MTMTINGNVAPLPEDDDALLVDVIRDGLGLTGTKLVCGSGVCGACTVLVDGAPVASCLLPAHHADGKAVTTIEGIAGEALHPMQKAFMANDALQCGFCTPGFIVEAVAFHDRWRAEHGTLAPSREAIGTALSGHLCRCGAYDSIFRAVTDACTGRFDDARETAAPRLEAREKVTGAAKYTVDVRHDGQLEGVILRANVAHARIAEIDLAPALKIEGVRAAVSLLGEDRMVRHVGAPIAAVAATSRTLARQAAEAIRVVVEEKPAVIGLDAARRTTAPVVFERNQRKQAGNVSEGNAAPAKWTGNLRGPSNAFSKATSKARGWINEARKSRDPMLVERTFRVATQAHACLEPHAAVASLDGNRLTVHVSTQAVFHLAELIAKRFRLSPRKVRVIAEHVGGGFGSKAGLGIETIAAVELARASKAPVRVALDRHEELSVTGYRPAAELKVALLPSQQGALKALSFTAQADTGAAINSTIAALARLIYPAEAKELVDFDVISNLPPGAPFRGPGGPPMAFALEQAIDEAALRLKVDPIQLRKRWDPDPNRQRLYEWAFGLEAWRSRKPAFMQNGRFRRGVGVATGYWLYLWQPGSRVELAVSKGRLVVSTAAQDIGTGTRTVLANTVAHAFGLDPDEVEVRIGDSALPEGPGSGGSRVTASLVPATLVAVDKLRHVIARKSRHKPDPASNAPWREMIAACADVSVTAERPKDGVPTQPGIESPLKQAGFMGTIFGWMLRRFSNLAVGAGVPSSVQVIEVEVDTWLGHVRVISAHTGIAIGRLAAPALARSQAAGSLIQGIGYALYEARELDPNSGHVLSGNMEDYRIPGIADTPRIEFHFDEEGFDHVPGGSVGIGEVATVPTAAALANAIRNATGVRCTELPIRPDRLITLLKGRTVA